MIASREKLGDLCSLVTKGTTPTSVGFDFAERGVPFLRIQNINGNTVSLNDVLYIEEGTHNALARSKIRAGDFLITIAGTIGRTAIVPQDFPESNCNQAVAILRFDESKLWPKFLLYWLSTEDATSQISGRKVTATISNLSLGQIKELEIPLPTLPEQKRIAAILDKADAIRRKRQQAIQLADDFLRAVFLDMFGDPVTNPKGWELKTLGELCAKITDGEHGTVKRLESGKLYLMARNIDRKGHLDLSDVSYISEADHQRIYKRCGPEKGDVLLVCVGATIGKALIVPDIGEFSLARSVALLKPGKEIVSEYLLSLINTDALQRQFVSSGNSSAQAGLYLGKIKEIMVPIPGLEEQLRFKEIVNFVKEKFCSKTKSRNLESDFVLSLSQKAFSGQL
ncbi:restriction endonuclease subunit S [Stutzerimonas stutzeri]|uniref:Restriction endonuclease subunit S n=1 Tax=Stutzerimonas stutzeri TaxID=316 RepID=A0ABD4Y653_STUST|nr:restriction endonuclease subunit S [Stutzerimonas stutzeri]MDH0690459.1 restriction endonuclease subunit S [Stutzerimonas stutzeri]